MGMDVSKESSYLYCRVNLTYYATCAAPINVCWKDQWLLNFEYIRLNAVYLCEIMHGYYISLMSVLVMKLQLYEFVKINRTLISLEGGP